MDVKTFALALFLAFLLESLVEYFIADPLSKIPKLDKFKPLLIYVSLAAGVVLALKLDKFKPLLIYVSLAAGVVLALVYKIDLVSFIIPGVEPSTAGIVLTGISISRGSNFLHRLTSKFIPSKPKIEPENPNNGWLGDRGGQDHA